MIMIMIKLIITMLKKNENIDNNNNGNDDIIMSGMMNEETPRSSAQDYSAWMRSETLVAARVRDIDRY